MNRNKMLAPAAATIIGLSGCAQDNPFHSSGDIVAGVETTVVSHTSSSEEALKAGPKGFKLYLVTEDCPPGKQYTPGPKTTPGCSVVTHQVKPDLFLQSRAWHTIYWDDRKGLPTSEITDRRYSEESYMTTVYHLGLVVRQCLPEKPCITDTVSVDPTGWLHAQDGQEIVFDGREGKPISSDVATFRY